jgi:hypothetical protein
MGALIAPGPRRWQGPRQHQFAPLPAHIHPSRIDWRGRSRFGPRAENARARDDASRKFFKTRRAALGMKKLINQDGIDIFLSKAAQFVGGASTIKPPLFSAPEKI